MAHRGRSLHVSLIEEFELGPGIRSLNSRDSRLRL